MDHLRLISSPLDITSIHTLLVDPSCGACSVFVGTTRDSFEGKKVISLEYEAYEPMAIKEMKTICTNLRTRWPDLKHIVIYHRLGSVPVGEASVVIGASAPHRLPALESVTFAVDQLKTRVPIWKKEMYEGDVGEWKENSESLRPKHSDVSSSRFNFSTCKVEKQNEIVSDKLVQIRVHDDELNKRVKCFVERKRMEINLHNIRDFTINPSTPGEIHKEDDEVSCARTQGAVIKQEQSNCHLKVRRVNNKSGPQQTKLRPNYTQELNKLMGSNERCHNPTGHAKNDLLNERLKTIETHIGLSSDENQSILSRLKLVENRILLLESTSPEYKHFSNSWQSDVEESCPKRLKRKVYCADDLNKLLESLKRGNES